MPTFSPYSLKVAAESWQGTQLTDSFNQSLRVGVDPTRHTTTQLPVHGSLTNHETRQHRGALLLQRQKYNRCSATLKTVIYEFFFIFRMFEHLLTGHRMTLIYSPSLPTPILQIRVVRAKLEKFKYTFTEYQLVF